MVLFCEWNNLQMKGREEKKNTVASDYSEWEAAGISLRRHATAATLPLRTI